MNDNGNGELIFRADGGAEITPLLHPTCIYHVNVAK